MGQDEAIKYNSLYKEAELAITNIANLGFDTSELVAELKEIHNEVNNNVKVKYTKGMAEASYCMSYGDGIKRLNRLSVKLEKYDVYVKAQNTCEYINMKLDGNVSSLELDKIISKMIYIIKLILNSHTIDYDNEKHIVEKMYETAYNVIKLELLLRGDSQLFAFVSSNDVNISYFNNLILKDIEKIDLRDEANKRIKTKYHELGEKGIYSNYLNLGLIKLILLANNDCNLKENLVKRTRDLSEKIIEDTTVIVSSRDRIVHYIEKVDRAKTGLNTDKKALKKRIASSILTFTLIGTGAIGIAKAAKVAERYSAYDKKIEIFSTETGISESEEKYALKYDANPEDSVILRIYDDNQSGNNYSYQEYKLEDSEYKNVEDYYDYVKDNYDVTDNRVEVIRTQYYREYSSDAITGLAYLFYIIFLIFGDASTIDRTREDYSWFGYIRLKNILKKYKAVKEKEKDVDRQSSKLKEELEDIMNHINQNDELRERFKVLYDENKYLLDDSDELLKRVNNFEQMNKIDDIKRLVKERK